MRVLAKSKMCVRPEQRPGEREHVVGGHVIYLAEAGIGIGHEKGLKVAGEWWPTKGTVEWAGESMGYGREATGEYAWTINSDHDIHMGVHPGHVEITREVTRAWRVPSAGDTVSFGHMTLDPRMFSKDGTMTLGMLSGYYVLPADGGEPWAIGPWAILEQIPPPLQDGAIITSTDHFPETGIGRVAMMGDGFAELMPGISVGMVVAFRWLGARNQDIPNNLGTGRRLTPILPEFVIGIDPRGITTDEIDALAAGHEAFRRENAGLMSSMMVSGSLVAESAEDSRKCAEAQRDIEFQREVDKLRDKNYRRHHRDPNKFVL